MPNLDFIEIEREELDKEIIEKRIVHFKEYETTFSPAQSVRQAKRCMQCAVPFCHGACPTSNLIPEFQEAVAQGDFASAWAALEETNPFPELTGRVCPAPCEVSCCLGAIAKPVSIKAIERAIGDWGVLERGLTPIKPVAERHERVTIVGSGPCGLAAAVKLREAGFKVRIYERAPLAGGLLRYGIPDFKLGKSFVDRRISWLSNSGIDIQTGVDVGQNLSVEELVGGCNALALAIGFDKERPLQMSGADKDGVWSAMDFLRSQNHASERNESPKLNASGKRVVVIGGGDTGWDCVGTALRQGARSVVRMTSRRRLPQSRPADNPWPEAPQTQRDDSQTEECASELYDVRVAEIMGDGKVEFIRCERNPYRGDKLWNRGLDSLTLDADIVLVAQGFQSSGAENLFDVLGIVHSGGMVYTDRCRTNRPTVFAGGDVVVGPGLVVTAIRSGLEMAQSIQDYFS